MPPAVLSHMVWRQKELEEMPSRPSCCEFCGSLIKADMYRHHVARLHLDLAQLWRCPVSWCTVWKGTYQDCMDHLRGSHNVPWEVKSASLEKFIPPWMVSRNVWSEALSAQHSGISTDVLLFSDIHLSLVHHYRVHKRGLMYVLGCSLGVSRGLTSAGGGCSCWSGGRESSSERDAVAPGFPACLGGFPWTAPIFVGATSDVGSPSSLATAEQKFPWSTTLPLEPSSESARLPPPMTPSRMVGGRGGGLFVGR